MAELDVPDVLSACADWQELAQFGSPYWRPRSSAELLRKIGSASGPALAGEYNFVVLAGGQMVGECSLHAIDWRNRVAQVGVCLWNPAERGRGHGRAAIEQLLEWADDHLDLMRLEAWILGSNDPSLKLFQSLGFISEGILRARYLHASERRDMHVLGRLVPHLR